METRVTTGTIIALACSAVLAFAAPRPQQGRQPQQQLSAQQRPEQSQPPARPNTGAPPGATGAGSTRDQNLQTTTMTGCLRKGASAGSYVFTQSPGTSVPDGGVGTAGGRDQRGNRFDLIPDSRTDLSKMVGRQVEITGTSVIGPGGSSSNTVETRGTPRNQSDRPAIGGGTGERDRAAGDAGLTRFNLKSIKQTGSFC